MKMDVQKTRGVNQENTFSEIKTKSTAHLAREFITQSNKLISAKIVPNPTGLGPTLEDLL